MPLRLMVIPALLLIGVLAGAVGAWRVELPSRPAPSSTEKMRVVESHTTDPQFRWGKALEIVDAETKINDATTEALGTGMELYRWSLLFIGQLMAVQLWLTYAWWKKTSNN